MYISAPAAQASVDGNAACRFRDTVQIAQKHRVRRSHSGWFLMSATASPMLSMAAICVSFHSSGGVSPSTLMAAGYTPSGSSAEFAGNWRVRCCTHAATLQPLVHSTTRMCAQRTGSQDAHLRAGSTTEIKLANENEANIILMSAGTQGAHTVRRISRATTFARSPMSNERQISLPT